MAEVATKYAVCELADVRAELKIGTLADGTPDLSHDDNIRRIINNISAAVESYTGWTFAARDIAAEKYDGNGCTNLMLKRCPIISVASVYVDDVLIDSDSYVVYEDIGKLALIDGTVFTVGRKNVSVTYRCGYERQNMPPEVSGAARTWVVHRFKVLHEGRQGIVSKSDAGGDSLSFAPGKMPDEVKEILDMYRGL